MNKSNFQPRPFISKDAASIIGACIVGAAVIVLLFGSMRGCVAHVNKRKDASRMARQQQVVKVEAHQPKFIEIIHEESTAEHEGVSFTASASRFLVDATMVKEIGYEGNGSLYLRWKDSTSGFIRRSSFRNVTFAMWNEAAYQLTDNGVYSASNSEKESDE